MLVEPTAANARRLCAALADFGFPALARASARFARPDRMATLGTPPLQIDIMTSISGVSFARAWRGRLRARLGAHRVGVLGRRELVDNKRAAGRTKVSWIWRSSRRRRLGAGGSRAVCASGPRQAKGVSGSGVAPVVPPGRSPDGAGRRALACRPPCRGKPGIRAARRRAPLLLPSRAHPVRTGSGWLRQPPGLRGRRSGLPAQARPISTPLEAPACVAWRFATAPERPGRAGSVLRNAPDRDCLAVRALRTWNHWGLGRLAGAGSPVGGASARAASRLVTRKKRAGQSRGRPRSRARTTRSASRPSRSRVRSSWSDSRAMA